MPIARSVISVQQPTTPDDRPESNGLTPVLDDSAGPAARRIYRARTEPMAVALRATGGVYDVRTGPESVYRVDIGADTCSCPDWQRRGQACKHLYRVRFEVQRGTVPTPDGRLPDRRVSSPAPLADDPESSPTHGKREEITGPHAEYDRHGDLTGTQSSPG